MARQDQSVGGGIAYQAAGALTVINGVDADQMASIMVAMGKHLQVYFAEAEAKSEERFSDFRKNLLIEFAKPANEAGTKAFRDPDFQFVLMDAQKAFVRDGSPELRDDLIKLLVQRSKHDGRERVAKILNNSIEIAGSFSKHEYAALVIIFLFTYVVSASPNKERLLSNYASFISPFFEDLSNIDTVYEYIESQRCGTINYMGQRKIASGLCRNYRKILSFGFNEQQLKDLLPAQDLSIFNGLLTAIDKSDKPLRFSQEVEELKVELNERGMSAYYIQRVSEFYLTTVPGEDQVEQIFLDGVEGFARVKEIWDSTPISMMSLTAVGKTIAYSTLSSRSPFKADLSVWVE